MHLKNSGKLLFYLIILVVLTVVIIATTRFFLNKKETLTSPQKNEIIETKPCMIYGFNCDSFNIIKAHIRKNQFFSNILLPYGISPQCINEVEDSSKNIFSVRKLQAGKPYTLLLSKDSLNIPLFFIYEINPVDYVIYKLDNPVSVKIMQKEVDTVVRSLSGIIHYSLWQDMIDAGASPLLINKMSEIYEWDIDFFRINKKDKFRIIFEEVMVEDSAVSIGKINSAWFEHLNEDYYAIYFVQNNRGEYFDDMGKNLRKLFLKAPLKFSRVSSGFSNSRLHPVLKVRRAHHGVDYAAPTGTHVHSVGDGVVIFAGYSGGAGNMVKIRHNASYTTGYLHLSKFAKGIRKGSNVKQGDLIGYVGSTGLSTGPHLDYRIWKNGIPVNPLTLKMPPVESVYDSNMAAFNEIKDNMIHKLKKIKLPEIVEE